MAKTDWTNDSVAAGFDLLSSRAARDTGAVAGTITDEAGHAQRGWRVFLDADGNGRLDLGERSTTTDADGRYAFADVAAGRYQVVAEAPFGWRHWTFGDDAPPHAEAQLSPVERLQAAVAESRAEIATSGHGYLAPDFSLPHVEGQLVVRLTGDPGAAQGLMESVGATLVQSTLALGVQLWQVGGVPIEEAARRLLASGQVAYADPNYIAHVEGAPTVTPDDPRYVQQYGPEQVNAPAAWAYGTGSDKVVVADIDSGVDMTHPDLAANIWTNAGEIAGNAVDDDGNGFVDDVHGWDFVNDDNDPSDDYGHGTHTSGTIGAVGDNGVGVTGIAWDVAIMPLKFIDENNFGTSFDAARAIEYATMMGAEITSNSYGVGPAGVLYDAIAAGGLFVAAAGNNASDNDVRGFFPASFDLDNIISVAAVDADRNLADFSNYGAQTVDLAAPGVHVMSTYPVWNGSYGYGNGTSMATPHVAGAAALLMALATDLSLAEIKAALLNGVAPVAALQGKVLTGGELDILGALNAISRGVEGVRVKPGRTQTVDFVAHDAATRGDDTLRGYDLDERIGGGRGDDSLAGGAGADLFAFSDRGGSDTIRDFAAGEGDRILIRSRTAHRFEDLAIGSDGDGGATVAFGATRIDVVGVRPGALGPDDFVFADALFGPADPLPPHLALA